MRHSFSFIFFFFFFGSCKNIEWTKTWPLFVNSFLLFPLFLLSLSFSFPFYSINPPAEKSLSSIICCLSFLLRTTAIVNGFSRKFSSRGSKSFQHLNPFNIFIDVICTRHSFKCRDDDVINFLVFLRNRIEIYENRSSKKSSANQKKKKKPLNAKCIENPVKKFYASISETHAQFNEYIKF